MEITRYECLENITGKIGRLFRHGRMINTEGKVK